MPCSSSPHAGEWSRKTSEPSDNSRHGFRGRDTPRRVARLRPRCSRGRSSCCRGSSAPARTTFVRGLAAGLGIDPDEVTSPTFTLVHEYGGGRLPLVHVDLYRLDRADLDDVGLDGELAARGVLAVEWAERLTRTPSGAVMVTIEDRGGEGRTITIVTSYKLRVTSLG